MIKAKHFYELTPKQLAKEIFEALEHNSPREYKNLYIDSLCQRLSELNSERVQFIIDKTIDNIKEERANRKYYHGEIVTFIFNSGEHTGRILHTYYNVADYDVVYFIVEKRIGDFDRPFIIPEKNIISDPAIQPQPKEEEYKTNFEVGERAVLKEHGMNLRFMVSIEGMGTHHCAGCSNYTEYRLQENKAYTLRASEGDLYKLNDPDIIYPGDKLRITETHKVYQDSSLYLKEGAIVIIDGFIDQLGMRKGKWARCLYKNMDITLVVTIPFRYLELILD